MMLEILSLRTFNTGTAEAQRSRKAGALLMKHGLSLFVIALFYSEKV